MRALQRLLSDLIKLFIGPHAEGSPDHPWWRILLVLGGFVGLFMFFGYIGL